MTDVEPLRDAPPADVQRAQAERLREVWTTPRGWRYWSAVNNSEVGIWYTAMSFVFFLFAGALKCRPPGMRINLIPLYVWYALVAAVMIVFAFPPLIAGSMLLEIERAFDWPFFDATRGGDPLLWQHLFWLFGHPEVYIIFLPSVALVAMIVPTFARRPMVGYTWVVLAAIGIGFLSFGLWVHHMYVTGLPGISLGLFSAASTAIAIPTGVQFLCFIATLLAGRVKKSLPMLWVLGGLAIFVLGGLTGVMVAIAPFDFQAHDTFFVVGHFHFVLIGGAIFPIIAGLYYPMYRGKQLSKRLGTVAFWLAFVGFNIAFLPMHVTGMRGMPRRVYTYPEGLGLDMLNLASTIGAFILGAGIADLAATRGEAIVREGIPSQGVPPCQDCNGPASHPRNAAYPHLAGQFADYLRLQLELFKRDQRGGSDYAHIMQRIAARLTHDQMRDAAAFYAALGNSSQKVEPHARR